MERVRCGLQVQRHGGLIGSTDVFWEIIDSNGSDFTANRGVITFIEGQRQADLILTIVADVTPELDETFQIQLTNVSQVMSKFFVTSRRI